MSTVFREPEPVEPKVVEKPQEQNPYAQEENVEDLRPVESDQDLLGALGIQDDIRILPEEDFDNLQELKGYLNNFMEEKGLPKTVKGYARAVEKVKKEIGLDEEADPQVLIEKIGSVAKAWKELFFVKDFEEKKRILIKLVSASSKKEMDRIIFEEMGHRKVWQ